MVLGTIQTHKQSLSKRVPIHSWVKRGAWGHGTPLRELRLIPKTDDPKLQVAATAPQHPTYIWSIYSDIETLKVVTARELVSGSFTSHSGSFTSHSKVSDGTTLYVVMQVMRDVVSSVEGWQINLHKPLPQRALNLGCWCDKHACYHFWSGAPTASFTSIVGGLLHAHGSGRIAIHSTARSGNHKADTQGDASKQWAWQ